MGTRKNNTFRRTRSKRQKGGAPKRTREDDDMALILASLKGDTETVAVLLKAGADVNAKDLVGNTALHWASYKGHTEIVPMLLKQKGIKVNANTIDGDTALDYAIEEEHTEIVKLLIRNGATIPDDIDDREDLLEIKEQIEREEQLERKERRDALTGVAFSLRNKDSAIGRVFGHPVKNPEGEIIGHPLADKIQGFVGGKRKTRKSRRSKKSKRKTRTLYRWFSITR